MQGAPFGVAPSHFLGPKMDLCPPPEESWQDTATSAEAAMDSDLQTEGKLLEQSSQGILGGQEEGKDSPMKYSHTEKEKAMDLTTKNPKAQKRGNEMEGKGREDSSTLQIPNKGSYQKGDQQTSQMGRPQRAPKEGEMKEGPPAKKEKGPKKTPTEGDFWSPLELSTMSGAATPDWGGQREREGQERYPIHLNPFSQPSRF